MKVCRTAIARKIRVKQNTTKNSPAYAQILEDVGRATKVLHIGSPKYIANVARERYNLEVSFG